MFWHASLSGRRSCTRLPHPPRFNSECSGLAWMFHRSADSAYLPAFLSVCRFNDNTQSTPTKPRHGLVDAGQRVYLTCIQAVPSPLATLPKLA